MSNNKDVIIACDFESKEKLEDFLKRFKNQKLFLKIGYELYFKYGNSLIQCLRKRGHKIFLDLKLHDIPNTVAHGIKSLSDLDITFLTIHVPGGSIMLDYAVNAAKNTNIQLLGVTQLTSSSDIMVKSELYINKSLNDIVEHFAQMAYEAKLAGVVCSVWESKNIKEFVSNKLITVCPGIRLEKTDDDQKRVATPLDAFNNKVDYIVVGRPITKSLTPLKTYLEIKNMFLKGKYE